MAWKIPQLNIDTLRQKLAPSLPKEPGGSRLIHTSNPMGVVFRKKNAAAKINDQLASMNK